MHRWPMPRERRSRRYRILGERLHAIVRASAPALAPRLWYGMPAYARDGQVVCFVQSAEKVKTRYATFGFQHAANLDDGAMWPTALTLTALTLADARTAGSGWTRSGPRPKKLVWTTDPNRTPSRGDPMPKFVIERDIPGAGKLSPQELQAISQKSCSVLRQLGPQVQWVQSFVTDDKIYCVYIAPDEAAVRKHAELGGFPANRVSRVRTVIDPTTAE
jgi:hypothetical protein